jgi:putative endopeptidase
MYTSPPCRQRFIAGVALLFAIGHALAATPVQPSRPAVGSFGFDASGMDRHAKPGDDFYRYANGAWLTQTTIPADHASIGTFSTIADSASDRTRMLLADEQTRPGSKSGAFYSSFLDEASANRQGLSPVRALLDGIANARDRADLAHRMAMLERSGVDGLIVTGVVADDNKPTEYAVRLYQSGLGLPDRSYYVDTGERAVSVLGAYRQYLKTLLELAGTDNASSRADAVLAFERDLARVQWDSVDTRNALKTYNLVAVGDLTAKDPSDWAPFLTGLGLSHLRVVLASEPSAISGEVAIWQATPLPVLKDWLTLRTLDTFAPYLSKNLVDAHFQLHGKILSGASDNTPRWKRGVDLVTQNMGEEVGRLYVGRYFPPAAKTAVEGMVANLVRAYRHQLESSTWLAPATKKSALEKLSAFKPMIGYPDHWRDYSTLQIDRSDLVGNVIRAQMFEYQRNLDKLGHVVDRGEWLFAPMAVNGWANVKANTVVFPAGILQPPLFDPNADAAVNYGAIGAVIGHEISHHFDDQGHEYGPDGALDNWWTAADTLAFANRTAALVAQYDQYEPLPGVHANGRRTLTENIADLAGLSVAFDAYHLSLDGAPAPVLDGFSGDQRFFLGFAQISRVKYRPDALRRMLQTNEHSPGELRLREVGNLDAWYDAFGVSPANKLYRPPAERIRIW